MGERRRKRILILLLIAAGLIAAGGGVWSYIHSPERKARALLSEIRGEEPQWFEKLLSKVGLHTESSPRERGEIEADLVALGGGAVPVLIENISNPDEQTARCAIRALGKSRDPRAFDQLIAILADSTKDSRKDVTIEALGNLGDTRSIRPLIEEVRKDQMHIDHMCTAMGQLGDAAIDSLVELSQLPIEDPDWENYRVVFCVISLTKIGSPQAADALLDMLNRKNLNGDCDILPNLITAVGVLNDVLAVDKLIDIVSDQKSAGLNRVLAVRSLGLIGDAHAVAPLIRVLEDTSLDYGGQAAIALGEIGDSSAMEPLIRALDKGLPEAGDALGLLGDPRSADALARAAEVGHSLYLRTRAVMALAELKDPRAADLLVQTLAAVKDDDVSIYSFILQRSSLVARSFLAGQMASRSLQGISADLKNSLPQWLGKPVPSAAGPHRPVEALSADLDSKDNELVREQAFLELASHPDPRSVDLLVAHLSHSEALDALTYRGDARALRPLWDALRSRYNDNKYARMGYGDLPIHRAIVRIRLADRRKHAAATSSPATATAEYGPSGDNGVHRKATDEIQKGYGGVTSRARERVFAAGL